MKISDIASKVGLTPKAIRYYEKINLISAPNRQTNGYRHYSDEHLKDLTLIKKSRLIGFTLDECRNLLYLLKSPHRKSLEVNAALTEKIQEIDEQITNLISMKSILIELANQCPNDERPYCPVMTELIDPNVQ